HQDDEALPIVGSEAPPRRFERHHRRDFGRTRYLEDVRGSLPDPEDLERMPPYSDDAAERIDGTEEPVDGPLLDDRDRRPASQFCRGERAAIRDAAAEDFHEPVIRAEHAQNPRVVAAVLEPLKDLRPDRRIVDLGEAGE